MGSQSMPLLGACKEQGKGTIGEETNVREWVRERKCCEIGLVWKQLEHAGRRDSH